MNTGTAGDGQAAPRVWGPFAALALTGLVWLVFNLLTFGIALVFLYFDWGSAGSGRLATNGLFLAVCTLINAVIGIGLISLLIRWRGGLSIRAYLGIGKMQGRHLLLWLMILALFMLTSEGIGYLLERPVVPDFMIEAYSTAATPVLLWLALIIAAPVFEETLFRGFLQGSLQESGTHAGLMLLLPAAVWAAIHLQYDYYDMSWVFLFGLLLGLAHWHTGSLFVPIIMHMLVNLLATIVTALML